MLDHLISELNARFNESLCQQFVKLLPSGIMKHPSRISQAEFVGLPKFFYEDYLSLSSAFTAELHLWQNYWFSESSMAIGEKLNTPERALKNMEKNLYPNIHALLLLAATIPGTSCECERSISNAEIDQNSFEKYNDPGEAKWISHNAIWSSDST